MAVRYLGRGPRNLAAGPLKPHIDSLVPHLRAEGRSRKTITLYSRAASWFAAEHLLAGGQPTDTDRRFDTADDTSADLVAFEPVRDWELVGRVYLRHRRHTDSYVNNQYRCLQQFFRWLSAEEEIPNPMAKMRPPKIAPKPVPVFDEGDVDRILKMPKGTDRCAAKRVDVCKLRASAILQLLKDTGLRVGDASIADRRAVVTGKGSRTRYVKFTHSTARTLDKYLRWRTKQPDAHLPHFWLSHKGGPLTESGIYQMVRRRARRAGVDDVSPHRWRHGFSHRYLARGGEEGDLMELNGWDSRQMLRHYGRSAAASRAARNYDRIMGAS
ncbi:tyrosine-type recombinase/integrase [Nocardiopsis changdeensis]|uniref:tyrosine-type recombinase/integrase n=1 Tax=Nocardiopsis changdeensis TaxID=2831969 RepID=UPI003F46D07D